MLRPDEIERHIGWLDTVRRQADAFGQVTPGAIIQIADTLAAVLEHLRSEYR